MFPKDCHTSSLRCFLGFFFGPPQVVVGLSRSTKIFSKKISSTVCTIFLTYIDRISFVNRLNRIIANDRLTVTMNFTPLSCMNRI